MVSQATYVGIILGIIVVGVWGLVIGLIIGHRVKYEDVQAPRKRSGEKTHVHKGLSLTERRKRRKAYMKKYNRTNKDTLNTPENLAIINKLKDSDKPITKITRKMWKKARRALGQKKAWANYTPEQRRIRINNMLRGRELRYLLKRAEAQPNSKKEASDGKSVQGQ